MKKHRQSIPHTVRKAAACTSHIMDHVHSSARKKDAHTHLFAITVDHDRCDYFVVCDGVCVKKNNIFSITLLSYK